MKKNILFLLFLFGLLAFFPRISYAQNQTREDVIWARSTNNPITLDGVLNEPDWAKADSLKIEYGKSAGLPTSGWRAELQPDAVTDPTHATVKFLISGNYLYLGVSIPDSSIGGKPAWAAWDGFLMSIKDKSGDYRPAGAIEFFYSWWYESVPAYLKPGCPPRFVGIYGNWVDTVRTDSQRAVWDAASVIHGNSCDSGTDTSWVFEMKIDITKLGYDVTNSDGDIVMLNFSIWDADFLWSGDASRYSVTRTHWQSPWGNANGNNVGRVHIKPSITVDSPTLPIIPPDVVIPNAGTLASPTIDGVLDESVWQGAYTFDIAWNDATIRNTYPGVGPFQSGQYQPELVVGSLPPILDPSYAKVKMFFKDNFLYVAADVNDQLVQGVSSYDALDGFSLLIGDRKAKNGEEVMEFRTLRVNFDSTGAAKPFEYLTTLIDSGGTEIATKLKGATTVNENTDVDEGYTIEMKIDLTKLGYSTSLDDHLIFMGAMLSDGDSFDDQTANYGTRTWWFRENGGGPATPWAVLDPNTLVSVKDQAQTFVPTSIELYGNYPNPFNPSTKISYAIPQNGNVAIVVYNNLGQEVTRLNFNGQSAGKHEISFDAAGLSTGVYFYQIKLNDRFGSQVGKLILLK
ncbi:MAG: T9SS type A sorting domain-containing protein [Ignavibacteriaceae bacterium]|jgi:hypothetical protein